MLPSDYWIKIAKQREADFIEEARIARLIAEANAQKPRWRSRAMARIGELLIFVGQQLKQRSAPPPSPQHATSESAPCNF